MNVTIIRNNYKYREDLIYRISYYMHTLQIKVANKPVLEQLGQLHTFVVDNEGYITELESTLMQL